METNTLIMYARPPILGHVKTRLQPAFTPGQSLALYEAMLCDGIERLVAASAGMAQPVVSFSGACEPAGDLADLLRSVAVEYQQGDDLGERMLTTMQNRLGRGAGRVVLIGSDSPTMPLDYIHQAFEALSAVDVVLGPSDDGGYYLIGARRLHPKIFQPMEWGTDCVLKVTRERIKAGRVTHHELRAWYDVDTPADVARLRSELRAMHVRNSPDLPRRTYEVLSRMPVPGR